MEGLLICALFAFLPPFSFLTYQRTTNSIFSFYKLPALIFYFPFHLNQTVDQNGSFVVSSFIWKNCYYPVGESPCYCCSNIHAIPDWRATRGVNPSFFLLVLPRLLIFKDPQVDVRKNQIHRQLPASSVTCITKNIFTDNFYTFLVYHGMPTSSTLYKRIHHLRIL